MEGGALLFMGGALFGTDLRLKLLLCCLAVPRSLGAITPMWYRLLTDLGGLARFAAAGTGNCPF